MNNLNKFLLNWEKRMDSNGNEVEKPDRDDYKDIDGYYDEYHWKVNNEAYNAATKVIALPDMLKFTLKQKEIDGTGLFEDNVSSTYIAFDYVTYLHQRPTIEMFVPWVDGEVMEEPEQPDRDNYHSDEDDYYERDFDKWIEDSKQYQSALAKVEFFGMEVYHNENGFVGIQNNKGVSIVFHPSGTISVNVSDNNLQPIKIHTLDDLNRECQLLKIVK